MKLDDTFAREVKKTANGDGSREARFTFMKQVEAARKALSSPEVARGGYDAAIKEYGRVPVAICTASTLYKRKERLDGWGLWWAQTVLALWTNRPPSGIDRAAIQDDTLHPTRICDYAAGFIRLTTMEG